MNKVGINGVVVLHAGDSFTFPLFLNAGDNMNPVRYILEDTDKVFFGIMEPGGCFEHALVRKVLTKADLNSYGDPVLVLNSSDTQYLMPGLYYYEAKLQVMKDNKEYIETVIAKTKLYIVE